MIDHQHLDETYVGKRARVESVDGEIAEIQIISIALPNKYDKTPESWGIVYDTISSNHPHKRRRARPTGHSSMK
jgi:hypothetical protein